MGVEEINKDGETFERTIFSHLVLLAFPLSNPVSQKPVVGFLCSFLEQDLVSEMLATIEDQEGHQPR